MAHYREKKDKEEVQEEIYGNIVEKQQGNSVVDPESDDWMKTTREKLEQSRDRNQSK